MKHRIDIKVRPPAADAFDDQHKFRNFVEAVYVQAWSKGWVADAACREFLNRNMRDMWAFSFDFPARQSHEATTLVSKLVEDHFMTAHVEVQHFKKVKSSV